MMRDMRVQILMAIVLFLSVTVIGDRFLRGVQVDLTEDSLYTISDGSRGLLAELEEPVTFTYYFSESLAAGYPSLLTYGQRVRDMLTALEGASGGNVLLTVIDPEPFSEAEDAAVEAGMSGVPLPDGTMFYMGLVVADQLDGVASIPFFAAEREAYLEYDLIKLVATLEADGLPTVGLLTTLPMQFGAGGPQAMLQGQSQPYVLYDQLSELFTLETIRPVFEVLPDDLDVLLIIHPPTLSDDQLFQIDQFVLGGGRLIAFLDPHAEAQNPQTQNPQAQMPSASDLGGLLAAWGVAMTNGEVVADGAHAQRIQTGGYGPDAIQSYVLWHGIPEAAINRTDVVTGPVNSLNLASTGALSALDGATTRFTPLVSTSAETQLFPAARAVGLADVRTLAREFAPTGEVYTLMARVEGPAKTAYPDRVSLDAGGSGASDLRADGDIHVVLGADADIVDDRFWVQVVNLFGQAIPRPIAGNGSLVLGLVEHMAGSDALLSLRSRGVINRPFTVVADLRRDAEQRYLAEEEALQAQLTEAEARLAALEARRDDTSDALYSPEQEAEIDRFRAQLLETRRALREVQRSLRTDIDRLGSTLAALNIAAIPVIILCVAAVRTIRRRRFVQK